jgi:hypothetical protein
VREWLLAALVIIATIVVTGAVLLACVVCAIDRASYLAGDGE